MLLKFLQKFPQTAVFWNRDRVVVLLFSFVALFIYEVFHFWPGVLGFGKPAVFNAAPVKMSSIVDTKFWDEKAVFHGYDTTNRAHESQEQATCKDFFALWPSDCADKYQDLDEKMKVLSAQMVAMNASLTLFVPDMNKCEFKHAAISVKLYQQTELLKEAGFEPAFPIMDTWVKTRYTRISDIIRLALAHKYGMSYLDTDITFLELKKEFYERSYVGAAIWSNAKNAIEISNGAFCLPKHILRDMMSFQRTRILTGGDKYFYTELGPSMFHNVLMNRHKVLLYSANNPAEPSLDEIARAIHQYGHKHLHLTGHVRKGNAELAFGEIVNTIRRKVGLPELVYAS
jgi:hypothetical protein